MTYRDLRGFNKFSYNAIMENFESIIAGTSTFTELTVDNLNLNGNTITATGQLILAGTASSSIVVNEAGIDVDFRVEGVGNANALFVQGSDGNVMVGQSSFSGYESMLTVGTGSNAQAITIYSGTSSNGSIFFADGTTTGARYRGIIEYDHSNDRMEFGTAAASRVYIDASGNVGIGTSSPQTLLHVDSDTASAQLRLDCATDQNSGILLYENGTQKYQINLVGTDDSFRIYNATAAIDNLIISSAGNVGIGLIPTANMVGLSIEAGVVTIKETTTPTADADYGKIYTKNDNKLYFQDGAGTEHEIAFV